MTIDAKNPEEYLEKVPEERKSALHKLRKTILDNLPKGFEETMSYGMIGYVIPHSIYPSGYHCDTSLPLPFMSFASQKNFVALYHSGVYAKPELLDWFVTEYPKHCKRKLDMGEIIVGLIRSFVFSISPHTLMQHYTWAIHKLLLAVLVKSTHY